MKNFSLYTIIIFVVMIVAALSYKYLFDEGLPKAFTEQIQQQQNPFIIPKDSSGIVWKRAKQWLTGMDWLIQRPWQETDSSIFTPYIKGTQKGVSIKIEKSIHADTVLFTVFYRNAGRLDKNGAKEVALYMNKGIGRSYIK